LILKHILILLILFDFVVSSVTVPGHLYSLSLLYVIVWVKLSTSI